MDYHEVTPEEIEADRYIDEKIGPAAHGNYFHPIVDNMKTAKEFVAFHRINMVLKIEQAHLTLEQIEKIVSLSLEDFYVLVGKVKSRVNAPALREALKELVS